MTQGRSNPWSTGLTHWRLAAGEARRGGGVRDPCSSDQMGGGEHLLAAGNEPHRLVVVVELGVAGIDAGDELCGCRGTGVVELVAREHAEGRAMVLRAPGDAVKLTAMVVRPLDRRSLVGDELGGGACG